MALKCNKINWVKLTWIPMYRTTIKRCLRHFGNFNLSNFNKRLFKFVLIKIMTLKLSCKVKLWSYFIVSGMNSEMLWAKMTCLRSTLKYFGEKIL